MATVRESVQEELVYIGTADKHLRFAIGKGIKQPEYFYSGAQKAAIEYGLRLEVSWAVTPTPDVHKASLVLAYEQEHDARPGFRRPDTGEWTPGVRLLVRKHGEAYGDLTWSAWMPMRTSTISHIPEELGVYRVRAVLRVAADVEETPAHPEVVHATEELTRRSLEDFVTEVPAWRARYLEGNGCIFKVEAFVRRDWENTSLQRSLCEEKLPWVGEPHRGADRQGGHGAIGGRYRGRLSLGRRIRANAVQPDHQ